MAKFINDQRRGNYGQEGPSLPWESKILGSSVLTLQPKITFDLCLSFSSKAQAPNLESPQGLCVSSGLQKYPGWAHSSSPAKCTCPGPWTNCFPFLRQDEIDKGTPLLILGYPSPPASQGMQAYLSSGLLEPQERTPGSKFSIKVWVLKEICFTRVGPRSPCPQIMRL